MVNGQWSIVQRKARGFTLIELLVVISIIGILIASATASWQNAKMRGRDGKRKSDIKAVQQALELYFATNGKYADWDSATSRIKCNAGADTSIKEWGGSFVCNSVTYLQQLPKDPVYQSTTGYKYKNTSLNTYWIYAHLENQNDPDLVGWPSGCESRPSPFTYCVVNP